MLKLTAIAILGVIVNIVGILGAAAPVVASNVLGLLQFLAPPLIGFWIILVGIKIYRHSSEFAQMDGTSLHTTREREK